MGNDDDNRSRAVAQLEKASQFIVKYSALMPICRLFLHDMQNMMIKHIARIPC